MNATPSLDSDDAMLSELAALGMRAARVVTRMMEIEQLAAEAAAQWLPVPGSVPAASLEAVEAGRDADALAAVMEPAVKRIEMLARALDRVSRSVRRTVALRRRVAAGWPRAGLSDSRAAMVRRQVVRGVSEAIRHGTEGEAAERLFDELAVRLEEPAFEEHMLGLPVDEVVRLICRDLGVAFAAAAGGEPGAVAAGQADTG